jgi:serine/threonine protein kinase
MNVQVRVEEIGARSLAKRASRHPSGATGGQRLDGLLQERGRLPQGDVVKLGLEACEALARAHRAGVLHGDVRPRNLVLARDVDGRERVELVDFSAARSGEFMAFGRPKGAPGCMAPEQLLALDVDARADVYGLGATLFECLTGRVPYEGSFERVLPLVCGHGAPLPDLGAECPGIAPSLAAVVERALARRKEHRFESATAMATALRAVTLRASARTLPPRP